MYSIGKIAKEVNITIRTLRYYDEIKLLKPSHVSHSGYRYYTEEDILRLQRILTLKKLGFNLEQIKIIIDQQEWKNVFQEQLEMILHEKRRIMYLEKLLQLSLNVSLIEGEVSWKDLNIFLHQDEQSFHNEYFRNQRVYMRQHFSPVEYKKLTLLPKLDDNTPESKEIICIIQEIRDYRNLPPHAPF